MLVCLCGPFRDKIRSFIDEFDKAKTKQEPEEYV